MIQHSFPFTSATIIKTLSAYVLKAIRKIDVYKKNANVGYPTKSPMPTMIEKEYSVHLDDKNRFAIRGAKTKHWVVKVFNDGHMLVSPQKLVDDPPISPATLHQIARSVKNFKAGKVSDPIDAKTARRALRS